MEQIAITILGFENLNSITLRTESKDGLYKYSKSPVVIDTIQNQIILLSMIIIEAGHRKRIMVSLSGLLKMLRSGKLVN